MPTQWPLWGNWILRARWCPAQTGFSTGSCVRRHWFRRRSKARKRPSRTSWFIEATRQAERPADVQEVCNYVDALSWARTEIRRPAVCRCVPDCCARPTNVSCRASAGAAQTAGRDSHVTELDRRHASRQRSVCASAGKCGARGIGQAGAMDSRQRPAAAAGACGVGTCPVRNDPSVLGRQRPDRSAVGDLAGRALGITSYSIVVSQPGIHAAPTGILSSSHGGSHSGRLGGLDGVLSSLRSGGCQRWRAGGGAFVRLAWARIAKGSFTTRLPRSPRCGCSIFCQNTPRSPLALRWNSCRRPSRPPRRRLMPWCKQAFCGRSPANAVIASMPIENT